MNSLATLSAEKSRMEASFQADKKQLRSEKEEVLFKYLEVRAFETISEHWLWTFVSDLLTRTCCWF
jgi:hypothetical protein